MIVSYAVREEIGLPLSWNWSACAIAVATAARMSCSIPCTRSSCSAGLSAAVHFVIDALCASDIRLSNRLARSSIAFWSYHVTRSCVNISGAFSSIASRITSAAYCLVGIAAIFDVVRGLRPFVDGRREEVRAQVSQRGARYAARWARSRWTITSPSIRAIPNGPTVPCRIGFWRWVRIRMVSLQCVQVPQHRGMEALSPTSSIAEQFRKVLSTCRWLLPHAADLVRDTRILSRQGVGLHLLRE
jgi:hypothetical protein